MQLIGSLASPFVRKVRVVLAEKKLDCEFVLDNPWATDAQVGKSNPLGQVPCLIMDGGEAVFDSRVIVEYIDSAAPNSKLTPTSNRDRAEVKRWGAVADGICDAAALVFLEKKRPKEQQSSEWIARQEGKIILGIEYIAEQLGENAWCTGNHFSLADIGVGCALGYLALRFPEIDWSEKHPNLARLYAKLMQRPSFADTVPQG